MFFNFQQYKPTWIIGGASAEPLELDFTSSAMGKWEDKLDDLDAMRCTKIALGKVGLPPKVCFVPGQAVHVQFDGGL